MIISSVCVASPVADPVNLLITIALFPLCPPAYSTLPVIPATPGIKLI